MCITPSPTPPCFAFLTWPKTSLTTTWWVCETCSSRSRRPPRGEKILPNICKCSHVQESFQTRFLHGLGEEIDNRAGLLHLTATSPHIGNRGSHYRGTQDERFT